MKLIKTLFVIMNWLAALLLVASTLAGVVRPTRCVLFSLLSYAYFPLLLANLAFMVLWLCFGSKQFLVSALVIVLRWSFVPLFFQVGGTPSSPDPGCDTLKVMSFNVHHFYGRNYVSDVKDAGNTDSNALAFLKLLNEEAPDILCLQEYLPYTAHVQVRDSMMQMGYQYYAAAAPQYGHSASICWSKYPITQVVCIDSSSKVQLDVVKNNDTIRFFSFHLDSYRLTLEDIEEFGAISHGNVHHDTGRNMLHKFRETILAHDSEWVELKPLIESSPYPCIVAGDFNDTPASYIYQQISKLLRDSYKEKGKGFCTTYHGRFPAYRIDYILHSQSLKVLSYRRVKSGISDHYPIFAVIQLPN